jgi:extracellular matrix regulatory protein A
MSSRARARAHAEPSTPAPLKLLNVGYGNLVAAVRVIAIVSPQSSPMRRLREEAGGRGKLVDATQGRRTRSILVTDSDHVILSALNPETIASRLDQSGAGEAEGA